jgi:hypothetical protein
MKNLEFEITIEGVEVTVKFDYTPEEATVISDGSGAGYPGTPEAVDNCAVYYDGNEDIDITELLEEYEINVEQLCWNYLKKHQ